jgi:hypothetical protein
MFVARRISLALIATCLCLVFVSSTLAAGPAAVTVRVEGVSETKLPSTQVTTTTEPVVKDGNPKDSCPGTTVLGALQLATGGNWSGPWEAKFNQYVINSIEGESHPFFSGSFWELWINHVASEQGACEAPAEAGQEILFAPCSEMATECPTLGIDAPASANVREPVGVTVKKYNKSGEGSVVAGATVSGAGGVATTDATGHATLTFSSAGIAPVQVSVPESVRTETTVCVHAGNDGTCGTTAPSAVVQTPANSGPAQLKASVGPAIVADLTGLIDGHRYARANAPRVLAGMVVAHASVTSISLRLRRTYRGRCWAYDGKRERFLRVRCRRGGYFRITSAGNSFSYLLPSRLLPGRYVLDISATDAAGNHTMLVRGTSRIVFYVA